MKTVDILPSVRVTVLNPSGAPIQTVLLSDYLRDNELSDAAIALILDGEEIFTRQENPVFNHSVRLA